MAEAKAKPRLQKRPASGAEQKSAGRAHLGHLDNVLGYALRRAQIAVFNDFRREFAQFEITPTQYAVLSLIGDRPGLKQSQAAGALGIKRANFVAVLDELERRDLVVRAAIPDDRRSYALHLTAVGESFTQRIRLVNGNIEARIATLLRADERDRLLGLLNRLTEALGEAAGEDEA